MKEKDMVNVADFIIRTINSGGKKVELEKYGEVISFIKSFPSREL